MRDRLVSAWDGFWFHPRSPLPICLFRILFGLLVTLQALEMCPDALTWYGPHGVLSSGSVRRLMTAPPLSPLLWGPASEGLVIALLILQIAAALCLTLGYRTRLSSVLVWFCLLSFNQRNPFIQPNVDGLLRVNAFLLMFAPAGAALSLDSRNRAQPTETSPWAQRLIQVQMSIAYAQSFWSKLVGLTWWNGTAVYYIGHQSSEMRFSVPPWLDHLWMYRASSYLSLLVELSLWSLIWIRPLRYPCLLAGLVFHLWMAAFLDLDLQNAAILAVYATFLEPEALRRWLSFADGSKWRRSPRN